MEQLNARVQDIALFSETHDDLATTIFAESQQLPFDSTGRIQLPEPLRDHAGIGDKAAFVGMGTLFRIWEPGRLRAPKAAAPPPAARPTGGGGKGEAARGYVGG